ncbi:MAG: hypothetical protein ACE5D7_09850 [Fidelibacterota bacterium]
MLDEHDKKTIIQNIYRLGYKGEGKFDGGALMCAGKLANEWGMNEDDLDDIAGEVICNSDESY